MLTHLDSQSIGRIQSHSCLILAVDSLVSDHSSSSDHRRSHTITNHQNHILRLAFLRNVEHSPLGYVLHSVVVGEFDEVVSRFVKRDLQTKKSQNRRENERTKMICLCSHASNLERGRSRKSPCYYPDRRDPHNR